VNKNRINPSALVALALAVLPCVTLAQNAFKVSTETGLEPEAPKLNQPTATPTAVPAKKEPIEITAQTETTFDETARVAVFLGSVTVKDPQFNLTCDKLTAYLKKVGEIKASASPSSTLGSTPAGPTKTGDKTQDAAGGLDRAVAEGQVVITQDKVDESTHEVTHYVGKGAKAIYDSGTGDMTLSGWPQIQQGINNQVATAEDTIMIMNRAGRLRTVGPSKSVIVDQSSNESKFGKDAKPGKLKAQAP